MTLFPLIVGLVLFLHSPAVADVVILQNEIRMTGVISEISKEGLTLKVSQDGCTILDPSLIVHVERQSVKENKRLLESWRKEAQRERAEEAKTARFARSQNAKGLSLFEGEWLSEKEIARKISSSATESRGEEPGLNQTIPQMNISIMTQPSAPFVNIVTAPSCSITESFLGDCRISASSARPPVFQHLNEPNWNFVAPNYIHYALSRPSAIHYNFGTPNGFRFQHHNNIGP